MTEITDYPHGATGEQIRELEAILGRELPADYAAFLRQYNGGVPKPNLFPIHGSRHFSNDEICHFLSLGADEAYLSILQVMQDMADRLPAGYIPIAESSCGTKLVLCTNAKDYGRVHYWDPGDLADDGGPAVWPVALSFSELLASLTEDTDADDPCFDSGTL